MLCVVGIYDLMVGQCKRYPANRAARMAVRFLVGRY